METRHNDRYIQMILGTTPGIDDKEIKGIASKEVSNS